MLLFHWRKHYYGFWTCILARRNGSMMDLFLINTQDVKWWTGVVWIIYGLLWSFISYLDSFWWHPFTAEDPLVRKMLNFSQTVLIIHQTHLYLDGLMQNLHFCVIFKKSLHNYNAIYSLFFHLRNIKLLNLLIYYYIFLDKEKDKKNLTHARRLQIND